MTYGTVRLLELAAERATYRDVFGVPEFRNLWLAQLLSVVGDQFARVALTVLVYDRTHSPLLAALTYAATIIPVFAGGVLLSGLADRLPRRTVMIICDVARCALVLVMAVPGVPLAALVVLLFVVTTFTAPFTAARSAVYPDILSGDRYVLGTAVTLTTSQIAQVMGFAVGGAVVGFLGARACLLADAATFAVSALLVRFGGLAAPLAHWLHGGDVTVGLLLAATALGISAGSVAFSRLVDPARRIRWMGPLAVLSPLLLLLLALHGGSLLTVLVLFASGAFACFQMAANAAFVVATPPQRRSQAFGLANAGIYLGQGGAVIVAGAAATQYSPPDVIVASGVIGTLCALALAIRSYGISR